MLNFPRIEFMLDQLYPGAGRFGLNTFEGEEEPAEAPTRQLRYPGSGEIVEVPTKVRKVSIKKTPAMRHGIDAFRRKDGEAAVPSLRRLINRPWLYAGTKVGAKLDRSWEREERGGPSAG